MIAEAFADSETPLTLYFKTRPKRPMVANIAFYASRSKAVNALAAILSLAY